MGYKERVNLMQIKHFMSMESSDEQRYKLEAKVGEVILCIDCTEQNVGCQKGSRTTAQVDRQKTNGREEAGN